VGLEVLSSSKQLLCQSKALLPLP